ncbi:MAG: hypothetical protein JWP06_616 [Candidatus Saccharibacteria bacterium]|nr:hypothetical protein [Candidatus Saccharibacteria bacterium]
MVTTLWLPLLMLVFTVLLKVRLSRPTIINPLVKSVVTAGNEI